MKTGCLLAIAIFAGASVQAQFTEVPSTAAPRTWLVEVDMVNVIYDRHTLARDGVHQHSVHAATTFLSTGLTDRFDVQIGIEAYQHDRFKGPDTDEKVSGIGNFYARAKWNLLGDEGAGPALAVLPYLKIPIDAGYLDEQNTEWGITLPFGCPLGEVTSFNAMLTANWLDNGADGYDVSWSASAVLARMFAKGWGIYVESGLAVDPNESGDWAGVAGAGTTFQYTEHCCFDCGVYAGLTRSAPDWNVALRFTCTL